MNYLALYLAILAGHVALVWLLPFFPTQDGPNHVYNLVILHDMVHGMGGWERYYSLNLHLAPNLGFTLFAYPLLSILSPLAVQKAFLTIYVLLFGVSVPVYLRALGKPAFPLSFFVFLPIFGQPLIMGFYSEVLGTPFLLLAVGMAWHIRNKPFWMRFLALNVAGAFLYVIHLVPFTIFVLAVEIQAVAEAIDWRSLRNAVTEATALLSPCIVLAGTFYLRHRTPMRPHWTLRGADMIPDIIMFGEHTFSNWQYVPALALVPLVFLAAREGFRQRYTYSLEETLVRRFAGLLCLALFGIYLAVPDAMIGGALLQRRFPPLILMFGLVLLKPSMPGFSARRYAQIAVLMAAATLAVNAGVFWRESARIAQFVAGTAADLPRGAMLLETRVDIARVKSPDALRHAACYYGLLGAVDPGQYLNFQQSDPYFQIRFRNPIPWEEIAPVYNMPQVALELPSVQYMLCWGTGQSCRANLAPDFAPIWSADGNPLSVWKRPDQPPTPSKSSLLSFLRRP